MFLWVGNYESYQTDLSKSLQLIRCTSSHEQTKILSINHELTKLQIPILIILLLKS